MRDHLRIMILTGLLEGVVHALFIGVLLEASRSAKETGLLITLWLTINTSLIIIWWTGILKFKRERDRAYRLRKI